MTARQFSAAHHFVEPAPAPGGYRLAQLAIARGIACQGRQRTALQVAESLFGHDPEAISIARAAVGAGDTSTATWARELVRADTVALLKDVQQTSVWAALSNAGTALQLEGVKAATVASVPLADATAEPAWVAEGAVIPLIRGAIAGTRIERFKLAGAVSITRELEGTSDGVEVMRRLLRQATGNSARPLDFG